MSQIAYFPSGKRELSKVANREAILQAAREVFGEIGFDAATVRDIIRRTNLSVGAFYNYYRSKEEVYEALADDGARRFRPILAAQYAAATDFQSYIRGAIEAYYDFLVQEHKLELRSEGERRPHVRAETPEMQAVFEQVRWSIADMLAKDHETAVDADYLAASIIAIAREVGERMVERRPTNAPAAVDFAVSMILGGLPALPRAAPH